MAQLMLHRDLLKDFSRLPVKVQKRVAEFVERFQQDPTDPSLHLHAMKESMLDPKVRGADLPDGYRAIVIAPEKGDTYLLVHIDKHDKAYAWARNKHFEVHEMTGVFQVFDTEEVANAGAKADSVAGQGNDYPLNRLSEEELFMAGVPKALIPAVKAIQSDAGFEALTDYLPRDCRDILLGVAAGMTIDEALEEMLGLSEKPAVAGPGDFTDITKTANYDLVLVEGEEHLKDILEASLEEWRIFLHPYQKKLVEWETKGPMNINGSAGTGKTVALIHRAVHLAKKLDNPKARILVTTFTTTLAITIKDHIRKLCPEAAERIEVVNLHALARTICLRSGWKGRIATEEEIADIWENVWSDPSLGELPLPKDEIVKEYDQVIDPNGIEEEDSYLTTIRSGRPRISRNKRRLAWQVFRIFQRGLKKRNLLTFEGAIHQARLAVEQGNFEKYRHVLVDEVQDFSLEALRLIRALSPIKEGGRDPLCTVGDGHQRIYRTRIPMSRAGIDIRGRSRRLKINYRTSEQIRKFSRRILQGVDIDDLDGNTVSTAGDYSVFKGPDPLIIKCKDPEEESHAIVEWVQDLLDQHSFATYEICVTPYKKCIREALAAAGIVTRELQPREADPGEKEPGVRLGTMKRIKGLEFRAVALACADPSDPMNALNEADLLHRCERYVSVTRARERLLVTLSE